MVPVVARRAPAVAVAARNLVSTSMGPSTKAADAARIKNNVVRGLGAAYGGRADLLRAIPSEDTTYCPNPRERPRNPLERL